MSVEIIKSKNVEDWQAVRSTGIGSSAIATIVGQNPFMSRHKLWEIKLGLCPPIEENEAMCQGHELEDAVARMFSRKTGYEIIGSSKGDWQFRCKEKPWMLASPDRTYWIDAEHHDAKNWKTKGILECKTTMRRDISADNIPDYWYCQVQWQLGIGEMEEAHIAWLNKFGCDFGFAKIQYSPEVFKMLSEMAEEFWCKNIMEKVEPTEFSAEDIKTIYPKEIAGKVAETDEELANLIDKYHQIDQQSKELDEQLTEIKDRVIIAIGDAERLEYNGQILATYKAPKPSLKLDDKKFKAENPALWDQYAREVQGSRRLLIK